MYNYNYGKKIKGHYPTNQLQQLLKHKFKTTIFFIYK
jgi:hypothetical protein